MRARVISSRIALAAATRIGRLDDRPADDEVIGPGCNGLRGRRYALLIAVRAAAPGECPASA